MNAGHWKAAQAVLQIYEQSVSQTASAAPTPPQQHPQQQQQQQQLQSHRSSVPVLEATVLRLQELGLDPKLLVVQVIAV